MKHVVKVRASKWNVLSATLYGWMLRLHPDNGRESYVWEDGIGWVLTENMAEDMERILCCALGVEYIA